MFIFMSNVARITVNKQPNDYIKREKLKINIFIWAGQIGTVFVEFNSDIDSRKETSDSPYQR